MTRTTPVVALLLALVGLTTLPATASAGSWSTPTDIATMAVAGNHLQVGVGADARTHVLWTEDTSIRAVSVAADGTPGTPVTIATYDQLSAPVMARTPDGTLHAFWGATATPGSTAAVMWTTLGTSGTWTTPQVISNPAVASGLPTVVVTNDGFVVVAWITSAPASVRARSLANGAWGQVGTVDSDEVGYGNLALASTGELTLSYIIDPQGPTHQVGSRTTEGGVMVWGPESKFGAPEVDLGIATAATDSGRVFVTWSEGSFEAGEQRVATYTPGSGWGAPERLAAGAAWFTKLVPRGDTTYAVRSALRNGTDGLRATMQVVSGRPGAWSAPTTLSTDPIASYTEAFADATGRLHAVWRGYSTSTSAMRASTLERGASAWAGEQVIRSASDLELAVDNGFDAIPDGDGNAVAAWMTRSRTIQLTRYDGVAPTFGVVTIPGTGFVQQGLAFTAAASDAGPQATAPTIRWSFGDGTAAVTGAAVRHAFAKAGRFTVTTTTTDAARNVTSRSGTVVVRAVTAAQVGKALTADAAATTAVLRRTRLGQLRRTWSFTAPKLDALTAGTMRVALQVRAGRRTVTLALGQQRFATGASKDVAVRIPRRMRAAFATGPVTANLVLTFTWRGGSRSVSVPVTLR